MARDYFPRQEFQRLGFSEPAIRILEKLAEFINAQADIAAAQVVIASQGDAIDEANTDITAANAAINVLDGRLDTAEADIAALEAAGPYVVQDGAAAPSFTGQTITNPPTQAEVQNIDDALALLITRLQTANVLT